MTTTPTVPCEVIYIKERIPVGSWESVIRKLGQASVAGSLSLLSISILVDGEGRPIIWTQPTCRKFEPRNSAQAIKEMVEEKDR